MHVFAVLLTESVFFRKKHLPLVPIASGVCLAIVSLIEYQYWHLN